MAKITIVPTMYLNPLSQSTRDLVT
jgi:hypothetical protein